MNTTPKEERDEAFYQDAFTSSSTWGPNVFESQCKEHGITEEDDEFFCHTAYRLWCVITEEEKAMFISDYDDWLDS